MCFVALSHLSFGQSGYHSFSGAQNLAHGQIASMSAYAESVLLCPAKLTTFEKTIWQISSALYPNVQGVQSIALSGAATISVNDKIGLSLQSSGIKSYKEWRITTVYAKRLLKNFSLGFGLEAHVNSARDYGSIADITFHLSLYSQISSKVSTSVMVYNPLQIGKNLNIPTTLVAGINYQPGNILSFGAEVEQTLGHPVRVKLGIDYQLHPAIIFRWGMGISPGTIHAGISWYFWRNNAIHAGWKLRPGGFNQLAFSLSNY